MWPLLGDLQQLLTLPALEPLIAPAKPSEFPSHLIRSRMASRDIGFLPSPGSQRRAKDILGQVGQLVIVGGDETKVAVEIWIAEMITLLAGTSSLAGGI